MKLVSIIIPTYNGQTRGFLSFAIESVLSQTYKNFELLIVDDGSRDSTKDLCQKYLSDARVTYVYQKNSGVAEARNNGIKQSVGEFICFLDDDDVWLPSKLEKQIDFVKSLDDSKLGLCYTALEVIDTGGKKTGATQAHRAHGDVFSQMLCQNLVNCTSSVMIPRGVLDDVGLIKEHLSYAEDYDLWLRIAKKYHLYSIDEPLVLYREHDNKLSANLDKIDFYASLAVFEAMDGCENLDKNFVFNMFYKKRAAHRFWLGDYKTFRRYIKSAAAYGPVGMGSRGRVLVSYFPWLVDGVRRLKTISKRLCQE